MLVNIANKSGGKPKGIARMTSYTKRPSQAHYHSIISGMQPQPSKKTDITDFTPQASPPPSPASS